MRRGVLLALLLLAGVSARGVEITEAGIVLTAGSIALPEGQVLIGDGNDRSAAKTLHGDASVAVDGTVTVSGIGGATNISNAALEITARSVTVTGSNLWEDLNFPATYFNPPGIVDDPDLIATWGPSGNLCALAFDKDTDETIYVNVQMPHARQPDSPVYPHLHTAPNTVNTGKVVWAMTYTWANALGTSTTYGASATVLSTQTFATASQWQHGLHSLGRIDGTGKTESSILCMAVYRDANNGQDSFGADMHLLSFDVHYRPGGVGRVFTP